MVKRVDLCPVHLVSEANVSVSHARVSMCDVRAHCLISLKGFQKLLLAFIMRESLCVMCVHIASYL